MKATFQGAVLAESDDTVVVEGNVYFPESSLNREHLDESDKTTVCGWKGVANYFHVTVGGETRNDAVWYYRDPKPAAAEVRGRVAFWKGVTVGE